MKWFRKKPSAAPAPNACRICGKVHESFPTDFGWLLPDRVWNEDADKRQAHLEWSTDICYYDEKWYLRGVLSIPFNFQDGAFGWGIWIEAPDQTMAAFKTSFDEDGSSLPCEHGIIATSIPTYPDSIGLPVEVQFGPSNLRPTIHLAPSTDHELARDQESGITEVQYHEILRAIAP